MYKHRVYNKHTVLITSFNSYQFLAQPVSSISHSFLTSAQINAFKKILPNFEIILRFSEKF